jgi:NADPH2:quinone reductase
MRAVVVQIPGDIEALDYTTHHPVPECSRGHVLVRNQFAGLNFIDTYHRSGLYPRETPFVLGQEGGGVISAVAENDEALIQSGLKVGDRVVYGSFGSYAEFTLVPVDKLVPVPPDMDLKTAVACMTQGLTAHYLSSSVGNGIAKPGDWVLVYAVGGGTGQWTAQMCKLRGFRVIGTTSRCKAQNVLDICDQLIVLENEPSKSFADYTSVDIASRVKEITNGQGCKLIIDGVGKATYEISLNCLAKRGLFVSFGNASGAVPAFPVLKLLPQSAYVTRPKLNDYVTTREELLERAEEVFGWVQGGKLKITVDNVFSLEDVKQGHAYLENGGGNGKILFQHIIFCYGSMNTREQRSKEGYHESGDTRGTNPYS